MGGVDSSILRDDSFEDVDLALDGDFDEEIVAAIDGAAPFDHRAVAGAEGELGIVGIDAIGVVFDIDGVDLFGPGLGVEEFDEIESGLEIVAGPFFAGGGGGIEDVGDEADVHLVIGAEHDLGELGLGEFGGELVAVAVDEPKAIFPLDECDGGAVIAVDFDGVAGGVLIGAADLADFANPGAGAEDAVDIDEELMIEGGMGAQGLGGADDLLGEEIAHPGGAIEEDDFGGIAGESDGAEDKIAGSVAGEGEQSDENAGEEGVDEEHA